MKNVTEVSDLLDNEISNYEGVHIEGGNFGGYVNDQVGNISIIISGFIYALLKKKDRLWGNEKWVDDALIEKFNSSIQKVEISGIVIWGRANTTKQWVSPFFFSKAKTGKSFICYFNDQSREEVSYEDFCANRSIWHGEPVHWGYIFNEKDLK